MACHSSEVLPREFRQLPDFQVMENNRQGVQDLTQKIAKTRDAYSSLPPAYQAHTVIRVVVIALLIIGIAVGIMALKGTLTSFPESFMHFIQNIHWGYVGLGVGGFVILTIGAAIFIHKAIHKKDPLTNTSVGKLARDK